MNDITREDYSHLSQRGQALVSAFRTALVDRVAAYAPTRILEVGCGQGWVAEEILRRLTDATYTGVDIREDAVAFARDLVPTATFLVGDAQNLDFDDGEFDLIVCAEVLEHVSDPAKALAEMKRVSTGTGVYSVPHEPWFWLANLARGKYLRTFGNFPGHIHHWSDRGFRHLLYNHYTRVEVSRSFPWLIADVSDRPQEG